MKHWGFKISSPRSLNIDDYNNEIYKLMTEKIPSANACIMCGNCTATCSANKFDKFSFRDVHLKFKYAKYDDLAKELDKCMLCGKCVLQCPRGINTRGIILYMRNFLNDNKEL